MLFSNRNEFLRDSSRIEPIPPNIRNDIVAHHDWRKNNNETSRIPDSLVAQSIPMDPKHCVFRNLTVPRGPDKL